MKFESRNYIRKLSEFYFKYQIIFPQTKSKYILINTEMKNKFYNERSLNKSISEEEQENETQKTFSERKVRFKTFFSEEELNDLNEKKSVQKEYKINFNQTEQSRFFNRNIVIHSEAINNIDDSLQSVDEIINKIKYAELVSEKNKMNNKNNFNRNYPKNNLRYFMKNLEFDNSTIKKETELSSFDINSLQLIKKNSKPSIVDPQTNLPNNEKKEINLQLEKQKGRSKVKSSIIKHDHGENSQVLIKENDNKKRENDSEEDIKALKHDKKNFILNKGFYESTKTANKFENLNIFNFFNAHKTHKIIKTPYNKLNNIPKNFKNNSKYNKTVTSYKIDNNYKEQANLRSNIMRTENTDFLRIKTNPIDNYSSKLVLSFLKNMKNKDDSIDVNKIVKLSSSTYIKTVKKLLI